MKLRVGQRLVGHLSVQSAPQAAAQALREAIISGELKGGDRVLEQKWSSRLGIGQPTLREALRELEHQGLLRKVPQRGTYVAELSSDDYRQILEVRIPLEAIAVGRAARKLTPEAQKVLTDLVMSMVGSGSDVDIKTFHDCDVLFHRKIWELAGNKYLQDFLEIVSFRLFVFSVVGRWTNSPKAIGEMVAAVQQHLAILDGILTGNPCVASQTYVKNTVQYWNMQYGLGLVEENIMTVSFDETVSA